ncbi:MAG: HAMP domain-containing protein, partial [Alphaproteobacteria bacterium]|nr:HAMP domain-containing protein [Alphaproteobacteria bacterium]
MAEITSSKRTSLLARFPRSLGVVLPFLMIGLTVMGSVAVGVAGFGIARDGLERGGKSELSILADSRSAIFDLGIKRSLADLETLATGAAAKQAITDLSIMIESLPQDVPKVQDFFQAAATPEERAALTGDGSGSMYAYRHVGFHGGVYSAWKNGGYSDIYLINVAGYIVYSVTKSDDFLLTLTDEGIAGSGLANAVARSAEAEPGTVIVSEYAPYTVKGGDPSLFLVQEIRGAKGNPDAIVGYVAISLDNDFFNNILDGTAGLGETGQTFLIDDKGTVLSDMPRASAPTALSVTIDNADIVGAAASGTKTETTRQDANGVSLLSVVNPVPFLDKKWAVVAERAESEVMAPVTAIFQAMAIATLVVIAFATLMGILISRRVTKPLTRLTRTMEALAGGALDTEVAGTEGKDELGAMARAVEVFREYGKKVASLTEEQTATSEQRRAERAQMMDELQNAFGNVLNAAVNGDFSQRVTAQFPDPELNGLAQAFNTLVETVEAGIGEAGKVLAALADTDLTLRVQGDFKGAFASLRQDTNAVADKLTEIVTQLRTTSRGLKTATGEILSGANDLSERTTKQAATIEETSAAMEQLAHTVMENAKRAGNASEQAKKA